MDTKYKGRFGIGEAKLARFKDGMLIENINIPDHLRGKGHGHWLLEHLLEIADKERVPLYLIITSTRSSLTYADLRDWYTRHGFKRSTGRLWKRPAPPSSRKGKHSPQARARLRAMYAPMRDDTQEDDT